MSVPTPEQWAKAREIIATLSSALGEAIEQHVYDERGGDVIPDDCSYTAAVAEADAFLEEIAR